MAIEVRHLEHTYTYSHPIGWSGGDTPVREKLNEFHPAGEYPDEEAELVAVRHALAGILAGGEVIDPETGRPVPLGAVESGGQDASVRAPNAHPDRILTEATGDEDSSSSRAPASDPERILGATVEEDLSDASPGDPDRILEG